MGSVATAFLGETLQSESQDFAQIVELHKRKVYFLALDLTGNHHDAEDLAQESFMKAYRAIGRFRGDAEVSTWLYRITVNTHVDRLRLKSEAAMRNHESWDSEEAHLPVPPDARPEANPERKAASAVIQEHIERALGRLSPQQQTIFVLRHYQHLKIREIARLLQRSEGTVKTTLFRAIKRLQEELAFYRSELGLENTP